MRTICSNRGNTVRVFRSYRTIGIRKRESSGFSNQFSFRSDSITINTIDRSAFHRFPGHCQYFCRGGRHRYTCRHGGDTLGCCLHHRRSTAGKAILRNCCDTEMITVSYAEAGGCKIGCFGCTQHQIAVTRHPFDLIRNRAFHRFPGKRNLTSSGRLRSKPLRNRRKTLTHCRCNV